MKIKISRLGKLKLSQSKFKVVAVVLFCISFFCLKSQSYQEMPNGTYQFNSYHPVWDLHFWLFDDGYHSFSQNPTHQYGMNSLPSIPYLYHAKPYNDDDDNVNDIPVGLINNGVSDPSNNNIELQNQIEIKRSWNLVNSNDNYFILMFENTQSSEAISGCVEFHFNSNDLAISSGNILDDYNNNWVGVDTLTSSEYEGYTHKYVWPFHQLKQGEQRFVYIPAVCLASSMSTIFTRGVLKKNECNIIYSESSKSDGSIDGINTSPLYTLRSVVSNFPHDPNYINSDPTCFQGPAGVLSQTFRYRLHFQNEGPDPSLDVKTDFFSNIKFGSVTLVDSSFPSYLSWNENGIYAGFNDINLRGLNEEDPDFPYEHTLGWIEIDVCYNLEDYNGNLADCIEFEGQVFFDNLHPIIAENSVCFDSHCDNENILSGTCKPTPHSQGIINSGPGYKIVSNVKNTDKNWLELFPNPASDIIKINGNFISENSKALIINVLGEKVMEEKPLNAKDNFIEISHLKPGVYFINIVNDDYIKSRSFIKI